MAITLAMLKAVAPTTPDAILTPLVAPMNAACAKWGIDTPKRRAGFLSQCAVESGGFTMRTERLSYSAERLMAVWPKRFPTMAAAMPYARNPEKLANKVYANRMGNGTELSGDGWEFRGRGFKQLTGRDNYTAFAKAMNMTVAEVPSYIETDEGACQSAAWFWSTNRLNAFADVADVRGMTLKINGGLNGFDDRKARWAAACRACGVA